MSASIMMSAPITSQILTKSFKASVTTRRGNIRMQFWFRLAGKPLGEKIETRRSEPDGHATREIIPSWNHRQPDLFMIWKRPFWIATLLSAKTTGKSNFFMIWEDHVQLHRCLWQLTTPAWNHHFMNDMVQVVYRVCGWSPSYSMFLAHST